MAPLWILTGLAALAAACDRSLDPKDSSTPAEPSPAPAGPPADFEPWINLVSMADQAHVSRAGPVFDPAAPGWKRVTQLGGHGPWLPPRAVGNQMVAYPDGIGTSIRFPVGPEGREMSAIAFSARPVAERQGVSVFMDEVPIATVELVPGWRDYRLPLPRSSPIGLASGEHHLRFFFRRTRLLGRRRTPAALRGIRLVERAHSSSSSPTSPPSSSTSGSSSAPSSPPADPPPSPASSGALPALPEVWFGKLGEGETAGALFAGPPMDWHFYLQLPRHARLRSRVIVSEGGPVRFGVQIAVDDGPTAEAAELVVNAGAASDLDLDLSRWASRPVRLSLVTEGPTAPAGTAGWIAPRLVAPNPELGEPGTRPIRNVILWTVDGLRADRLGLKRGGERAATPNLDMLAAAGAAMSDVWCGGPAARDGHHSLLLPSAGAPSLPAMMGAAGQRTVLISASDQIDAAATVDFHAQIGLSRPDEAPTTHDVLHELNAWLVAHRDKPFFIYAATNDTHVGVGEREDAASGYRRLYARRGADLRPEEKASPNAQSRRLAQAAYDAKVSLVDYWIGQLLGTLGQHQVLDHTLLVVAGTAGSPALEEVADGEGSQLTPAALHVPVIIWHPAWRTASRPRPLISGGDLVDVPTTLAANACRDRCTPPPEWPGQDLVSVLFERRPLQFRPSQARLGALSAARLGPWFLRGDSSDRLRLWNLVEDPHMERDLASTQPIAFRLLRDSLTKSAAQRQRSRPDRP